MKRKPKQKPLVLSDRDQKIFIDSLMNPPAPSQRLIQAAKQATKHRLQARKRREEGNPDLLLKQAIQELRTSIQSARKALRAALTEVRRTFSIKHHPIRPHQGETSFSQLLAQKAPKDLSAKLKRLKDTDKELDRSLARLKGRLNLRRPFEEIDPTEVINLARKTFGSSQKTSQWLNRPNRALKGRTPLSLLSSKTGVKRVKTILGRIQYGVYS